VDDLRRRSEAVGLALRSAGRSGPEPHRSAASDAAAASHADTATDESALIAT